MCGEGDSSAGGSDEGPTAGNADKGSCTRDEAKTKRARALGKGDGLRWSRD